MACRFCSIAHMYGRSIRYYPLDRVISELLNLQKRVNDLMQVTKLLTVFDVYDSEAAAIKSFSK